MQQISSPPQAQADVVINENFKAVAPAAFGAYNFFVSSGLVFGLLGGRWGGTLVADISITLNASSTNYLVANRSTGALSLSADSPNDWDDTENFGRLYKVTTSATAVTAYEDHRAGPGGILQGGAGGLSAPIESIIVAVSDESTALTAGTSKVTFRMPYGFALTAVRASLRVAQASGSIFTVDINEGGTSILSTKLTIDNTEKTSTTASSPCVISDATLSDDAEMSVDIDQVGSGSATGLKVYLIGRKT